MPLLPKHIDHTLLKPDATQTEIDCLCEEAVEYGFASVCVPPLFVRRAAHRLYGSEVAVGTVVGFPLGYETTAVKVLQTRLAVAAGAAEVDMVIRLGDGRDGRDEAIVDDIRNVVAAADGMIVKVIIECCLFDDALKSRLVEAVVAGGADYVKTSTGFAAGGATSGDVALLAECAEGRIKVKAAGGIRSLDACQAMLAAGADRIGTSAGVAIVTEWLRRGRRG